MDNIDVTKYSIGVFIGRLQVHEMHEGHHYVIKQVVENHKKTIIFLGVPRFIGTKKNPLDFDTRKKMVQTYYPECVILPIQDQSENFRWAHELDRRIREIYPHGEVLMYGSRDSFIPHYLNGGGKFQTKELEPLGTFAGTDVRRTISEDVKNSLDFRCGVIYHAYNLYPRVIPTVDIAPLDKDGTKVLLAKKYDESKWRFIGGFVKPEDDSIDVSARRVYSRETGGNSESGDYRYLGTCRVPDWRFRSEEDKVMTTFFTCKYLWGGITPSEEIGELKWFNISELNPEIFMTEHQKLLEIFIKNIAK
jgi:bifunctional NMN adenylyltransferase/nudix hydrolase